MEDAELPFDADPFHFVYRPWVVEAARGLGVDDIQVALALIGFFIGVPFGIIANELGLTSSQVRMLYHRPWAAAALGTRTQMRLEQDVTNASTFVRWSRHRMSMRQLGPAASHRGSLLVQAGRPRQAPR